MSNVQLPKPDISVPFLSEVRKVPQGDYYRADKVLPLLKQWPVLYEAAKAGHEQAFAEAQNAAAVSAAKDKEIAQLRAELIKSLADNAALRAEVAGLREDAERYRHMRNNSQFQSRNGPGLYWYLPRGLQGDEGEQLDAAIDAARKGEA